MFQEVLVRLGEISVASRSEFVVTRRADILSIFVPAAGAFVRCVDAARQDGVYWAASVRVLSIRRSGISQINVTST